MDEVQFLEGLTEGVAGDSRVEPTKRTISGHSTIQFQTTEEGVGTMHWVAWLRSGTNLVIMVGALTSEESLAIATAMIQAQA